MSDGAVNEQEAMARAIKLARRGWGQVAPNPLVGTVLLKDGQVIAEGYHAGFGKPHAELAALAACGAPEGATCVVNLEPCTHAGKTPPCTDALVSAGVKRVVFGVRDPHPDARGGADRLRQSGVEVEEGLLREEAAALNAPFLWAHARPERPFIALKVATSLDGLLADQGGQSKWISGTEAREFVHWLRAGFDAIAVGRRTVEVDDPLLTVRGPVEPRVPPSRVVISRSGMLRRNRQVVRTAKEIPTIVVTSSHMRDQTEADLAKTGVTVLGADGMEEVAAALRQAGVQSVLVEGGGSLAGALLEAHLVDRIYWIQAPLWLGVGVPAFGDREGMPLENTIRWAVTERRGLGQDTLLVVDRELCLPGS
ncbi:MAG: bifunctional diaminohydroxyphosphoribosylaminopyrimidine deaminase/5-amino-6-(5-phosphoribosylamino)uracil reductase RibD [Gemmatimonadales bacterium]|nr:bifunctional diaminohydroxyphosphoribosylaminopyrimidine deaminase/5-amino-6-(5-phosphoribosylamino)uracil reductase RibD [Gemmatimonadales bacterium]